MGQGIGGVHSIFPSPNDLKETYLRSKHRNMYLKKEIYEAMLHKGADDIYRSNIYIL